MNYEDVLDKIHSFGRFGSRLGLERMMKLLKLLGNPQDQMKTIHVAGTNGKGSVSRNIYTILQTQGYKTGLYTSPFLERFTERIEFNGYEITKEDLVQCAITVFKKAEEMISQGSDSPTEFEIVTAIAFIYFKKMKMDYLVLEVGLGGRGDATNVIHHPIVSVITTISLEHTEYLGDSLSQIAFEKSGIIKNRCPVVTSVTKPEALEVIKEICNERQCPLTQVPINCITKIESSFEKFAFDFLLNDAVYPHIEIGMLGMHQIENAATAITVIDEMRRQGIPVDNKSIYNGLRNAKQNGRFEIVSRQPLVIIDGAHNLEGIRALKNTISQLFANKKILLCIGLMKDKKVHEIVEILAPYVQEVITTEPENDRKMSACELSGLIGKHKVPSHPIPDIVQACEYAMTRSSDFDAIIFTGSLYLIGKVRGEFIKVTGDR